MTLFPKSPSTDLLISVSDHSGCLDFAFARETETITPEDREEAKCISLSWDEEGELTSFWIPNKGCRILASLFLLEVMPLLEVIPLRIHLYVKC